MNGERMMRAVLIAALVGATISAFGQTYEDGPCKGLMQDECAVFQSYKQQKADEKEAQELKYQRGREEDAAYQKAKQDAKEKQQAEWAADYAKRKAEDDARQAEYKRQSEANDRRYAAAEKKAATEVSVRKEKCGDDYKAPRVGMLIDRVRECVTTLKIEGQLNGPNGLVTTYRGGGGSVFHVIEGRVVGWSR